MVVPDKKFISIANDSCKASSDYFMHDLDIDESCKFFLLGKRAAQRRLTFLLLKLLCYETMISVV